MPRKQSERVTAKDIARVQGGVPELVRLLIKKADTGDAEAREIACAQLRSLAQQDHREHCPVLFVRGAVRVLVKNLHDGSVLAQSHAAGALHHIGYGAPEHQQAIVDAGGVEPLVRLLKMGSAKVQEEVRCARAPIFFSTAHLCHCARVL